MSQTQANSINKDAVNQLARQSIEFLGETMSQQDIAKCLDIPPSTLSRYLKGAKEAKRDNRNVIDTISVEAFIRLMAAVKNDDVTIGQLNRSDVTLGTFLEPKMKNTDEAVKSMVSIEADNLLKQIIQDLFNNAKLDSLGDLIHKMIVAAADDLKNATVKEYNRAFSDFVTGDDLLKLERASDMIFIANSQVEKCIEDGDGHFCRDEAENIYYEEPAVYYYWIIPIRVESPKVYLDVMRSNGQEALAEALLEKGDTLYWQKDYLQRAYRDLLYQKLLQSSKDNIDRRRFDDRFSDRVSIRLVDPFPFGSFALHAFDDVKLQNTDRFLRRRILKSADESDSFAYDISYDLGKVNRMDDKGDVDIKGCRRWCGHVQLRSAQNGLQQLMEKSVANRAMELFSYLFSHPAEPV